MYVNFDVPYCKYFPFMLMIANNLKLLCIIMTVAGDILQSFCQQNDYSLNVRLYYYILL